MVDDNQELLQEAQALSEQLQIWRRDLHRHPELAFEEHRTAAVVAEHLARLGMEVETGVGRTGVVGLLSGTAGPGPTVFLRFDMDALPIQEETGLSFASQFPGRMHACGHDGHVAIGLGVATLLERHRHRLAGRVKLVFQPAEEIANGARAMIEDGVLEEPTPDVAFGLHLWSLNPLGHAIVRGGPLWASSDRFDVRIVGRGSHGALPHQGVDVITVASYAVAQLQTVVSRSLDPLEPAVLSVGTVNGGSAFNVLAEEVCLSGTLRTFSETTRNTLIEGMHRVLGGVCSAHGAQYELSFTDYTPPLVNDAAAAERLRVIAAAMLGPDAVFDGPMLMVAEDMAEFLNRVPGCYFVLGARRDSVGPAEPHHSPRFDIDERALPLGAAILAGVVMDHLTP